MLKNYWLTAYRNFLRQKGYSFIILSGLSIGLTTAILISIWVLDEISFDKHHEHRDRIFQVMGNHKYPNNIMTFAATPGPLSEALRDLPEIEEAFRATFRIPVLLTVGDVVNYEEGIFAEPGLFKTLTIDFINGNAAKPLSDYNSIAISRKLAEKYFNSTDVVGKTLRVDNQVDVKVTSVFENIPENSTIRCDFILPFEIFVRGNSFDKEWGSFGGPTYVKLVNAADPEIVGAKIHELITKPKLWPAWDSNVEFFLFPMSKWRLYSAFENGKVVDGRVSYVKAFSFVGIFILVMACINFMNLATARATRRSKEVGLRKIIGASRKVLIGQFLSESILYAFTSLLIAMLAVILVLPYFNEIAGKNMTFDLTDPNLVICILMITLLAGLFAGSYPAFFLALFNPLNVLKGNLGSAFTGATLRKGLVVFQYIFSVLLIIGSLVIYRQINYWKTKPLGFDKENIFYFQSTSALQQNFETFKLQSLQDKNILSIGAADANPIEIGNQMDPPSDAWPGKTKNDAVIFRFLQCDWDFLKTLNFAVSQGRLFSQDFPADTSNFIINEEAARRMKLSDPVGQSVKFDRPGQIVGVVKDFHSNGLKGPIEPVIIAMRPKRASLVFVRYQEGQTVKSLESATNGYKQFETAVPFQSKWMDEPFGRQYQNEILVGKLSTTFTFLAIFVACLGLIGLASFATERRAKEIAVRKVLGASVGSVIVLLCREFVVLVLIALVIGSPLGYYFINDYLQKYTYHIELGVAIFIGTAVVLILLTLLIVALQSIRAARQNPVSVIRNN